MSKKLYTFQLIGLYLKAEVIITVTINMTVVNRKFLEQSLCLRINKVNTKNITNLKPNKRSSTAIQKIMKYDYIVLPSSSLTDII